MLTAAVGCGHNIGDPCQTNVDCSPAGDRFCDTASPGGYCTQENCDVNSCPGNSICIRFFTALADEKCSATQPCRSDERCVRDGIDPTQPDSGHCAPSSTERRWCQARCAHDSDCRSGYECRHTGTLGAEAVPTFDMSSGESASFCAPTGISSS
jgi:hypothetical protein